MKKNLVKVSLVAAMLLSSGAYAGQIIGANPNIDEPVPLTQYGFGGWYFGDANIEVAMVAANGNPTYSTTFDQETGEYPQMSVGDSFVSSVYQSSDKNILLAKIGGKDYPVGEPAGIKVINGDTQTNNGKPENCIMTTSYLEGTYLDTANPEPVICSSGFQTHKRFKVVMLEAMVNALGALGNPVELKFNLDPNDTSTGKVRYQVFQKINNYTGLRLDGYTLRVLDENGTENPNITLSLGTGENAGEDIWGENELANFAHGLWGPPDNHFPEQGFFDNLRAYYPVTLNEDNNTISYAGSMLGGNYQTLFGNWLTDEWAPTGIFFDNDNDPSTDAELMAFWGVPPGVDPANIGWYHGEADGWAPVNQTTLLTWATNPLYFVGLIEDVLNLGINYIVEVGENANIGDTFTIEITPHADTNQTVPVHMSEAPSLPDIPSAGSIVIVPEPTFDIGTTLRVAVADIDLNIDEGAEDNVTVTLTSTNFSGELELLLTETDVNSSVFTGDLVTHLEEVGDNDISTVLDGTVITATYVDADNGAGGTDVVVSASTTATAEVVDPDPGTDPSSGGGGGCTYNPNSKNFDMTFLMLMALGLLYPFRRRLFK